jgi:Cu/Ag efflux pump CusA
MHLVEKPGTSVEAMQRVAVEANKALRAIPGVRNFGSHIGRAEVADEPVGSNFTELWIGNGLRRGRDQLEGRDAGARAADRGPPAARGRITCNVQGRDLGSVAQEIEAQVRKVSFPREHQPEFLGECAARQEFTRRLYALAGLAMAGMVPLVVSGNRPGHEIEYPLAVVILGGLATSTALNLFLLPPLYARFARATSAESL